jgi:hypothetical protein
MKKLVPLGITFALFIAAAPIAMADTYYITFSADGAKLTGDLTTGAANNGGYDIISLTNATYTDTNTGLSGTATLDTDSTDLALNGGADNIFYPSKNSPDYSEYLDFNGFLLEVSGGYVNIYNQTSDGNGYTALENTSASGTGESTYARDGTFTATKISATPEPSSWLLLGSGVLGLIALGFRRKTLLPQIPNR